MKVANADECIDKGVMLLCLQTQVLVAPSIIPVWSNLKLPAQVHQLMMKLSAVHSIVLFSFNNFFTSMALYSKITRSQVTPILHMYKLRTVLDMIKSLILILRTRILIHLVDDRCVFGA